MDSHGGYHGASAFISGESLMGYQVYDAMRAVDYLATRTSEVDMTKFGVTGPSGGGQLSMFLTAVDDRIDAAVISSAPLLGQANKVTVNLDVGEVIPDWLSYTSENYMLSTMANRPIRRLYGAGEVPGGTTQTDVENWHAQVETSYNSQGVADRWDVKLHTQGHGYPKEARESAYGWFDKWLKGVGTGAAVAEGTLPAQASAEDLKHFKNGVYTIDMLTYEDFKESRYTQAYNTSTSLTATQRRTLLTNLLKSTPAPGNGTLSVVSDSGNAEEGGYTRKKVILQTERNIQVPMFILNSTSTSGKVAIMLDDVSKNNWLGDAKTNQMIYEGYKILVPDLRGIGESAWNKETTSWLNLTDGDLSASSMHANKRLLGSWYWDVKQIVSYAKNTLSASQVVVWGKGKMGLVSLFHGALNSDVNKVAMEESLGSYLEPGMYGRYYTYKVGTDPDLDGFRSIAALLPGILGVGDVNNIAALAAPKPLLIIKPKTANGDLMNWSRAAQQYYTTYSAYNSASAPNKFRLRKWFNGGGGFVRSDELADFIDSN